ADRNLHAPKTRCVSACADHRSKPQFAELLKIALRRTDYQPRLANLAGFRDRKVRKFVDYGFDRVGNSGRSEPVRICLDYRDERDPGALAYALSRGTNSVQIDDNADMFRVHTCT